MGEKETRAAENQFKKAQAKNEGDTATAAYQADQNAVIARTAKLRGERLAREVAAEAEIAKPKPVRKLKRKDAG